MATPIAEINEIDAKLNMTGDGKIKTTMLTVAIDVKIVINSAVEYRFARCLITGDPVGKNSYNLLSKCDDI